MNKIRNLSIWLLMSAFLLAMGPGIAAGAVIYVDDEASVGGNGQSWGTAYKYLQDGLATAVSGDEIWVAAGTYKPDEDAANIGGTGIRTATFQLKSGVALYGGFAGSETSLNQRDWETNETILSGDIGTAGVNTDNSRHVVTGSWTDDTAVLDGFTIMGGYEDDWPGGAGMYNRGGSPTLANCVFSANWTNESGGGMHNRNGSCPTLTNCIFVGNTADEGGGMYNSENSNTTLTNCIFTGNFAHSDGGGMYNMDGSSSTLANCSFTGNSAVRWGGGMFGGWGAGDSTLTECTFSENSAGEAGGGMNTSATSPTLVRCTFNANSAQESGGGMSSYDGSPTLVDCTFGENSAKNGGGMRINSTATLTGCTFTGNLAFEGGGGLDIGVRLIPTIPTVSNCTFRDNSAEYGGGIRNVGWSGHQLGAAPIVDNCVFSGNSAISGGGMFNEAFSSPTLSGCTFTGNAADEYGGGIYSTVCSLTLTGCIFSGNSAEKEGGGIHSRTNTSATLANCAFRGNSAGESGGGMCNSDSSLDMVNCIFVGNTADEGGGMFNYYDDTVPRLINCTFSGNLASSSGGGVYNVWDSNPVLANCILWGNTPDEISGGTPDITYSDVEGGTSQPWFGAGCIDADPMFADADLRLSAGSPCIDAGDNSAVLVGTDLDGNPRIVNGIVDMGAYEAALLDPVELVLNLTQDVIDLDLPKGIENSLVSKLEAAIDSLNRGQDKAARNQLNAFINLVEAQRGKKISDTNADALIAEALEIIELLSTG